MDDGPDQPLQHIIVLAEDNRKFKMVMRGNLSRLAVAKIKRYLEKSTGVPPEKQILTYNGQLLADDMVGRDFSLVPEGVFNLAFAAGWGGSAGPVGGRAVGLPDQPEYDAEGRGRQRAFTGYPAPPTSLTPAPATTHNYAAHTSAAFEEQQHRMARMTSPRSGGGPASATPPMQPVSSTPSGGYSTAAAPLTSQFSAVDDPWGAGASSSAAHPLSTKVNILEDENRTLRAEIDRLRRSEAAHALHSSSVATPGQSVIAMARSNLHELGKELGQHLAFDDSLSCVIGADEQNTVVVTVDPPTERMYVYSTLLTSLPREPSVRLRLFEAMLEWSMLGRDVAGGALGVCPRSGIALMSTTIDLRHCTASTLRDTAPVFIECLVRWRREALNLVAAAHGAAPSGYSAAAPSRAAPAPPTHHFSV